MLQKLKLESKKETKFGMVDSLTLFTSCFFLVTNIWIHYYFFVTISTYIKFLSIYNGSVHSRKRTSVYITLVTNLFSNFSDRVYPALDFLDDLTKKFSEKSYVFWLFLSFHFVFVYSSNWIVIVLFSLFGVSKINMIYSKGNSVPFLK